MPESYQPPRRSWPVKLIAACRGIGQGARGQSSFAVHAVAAVAAVLAAALLGVTRLEWALVVLCTAAVWSAELLNTALERLAKAIDEDYNPHLAAGLDIASGGVLIIALGAALVGLLIFVPRILSLLGAVTI